MWDSTRPISELPERIKEYYTEHANWLYQDLINNKIGWVLVQNPNYSEEDRKVRKIQTKNPKWYSGLYNSYSSFRRDLSLRALNRIRNQEDRPFIKFKYKYDLRYRELITDNLLEGYETYEGEVPPNNEVRLFFGLEEVINFSEESFLYAYPF